MMLIGLNTWTRLFWFLGDGLLCQWLFIYSFGSVLRKIITVRKP